MAKPKLLQLIFDISTVQKYSARWLAAAKEWPCSRLQFSLLRDKYDLSLEPSAFLHVLADEACIEKRVKDVLSV